MTVDKVLKQGFRECDSDFDLKCRHHRIEEKCSQCFFPAETKYFSCRCTRCADPTELGTMFSSIRCQAQICITCTFVTIITILINTISDHPHDHSWGVLSAQPSHHIFIATTTTITTITTTNTNTTTWVPSPSPSSWSFFRCPQCTAEQAGYLVSTDPGAGPEAKVDWWVIQCQYICNHCKHCHSVFSSPTPSQNQFSYFWLTDDDN